MFLYLKCLASSLLLVSAHAVAEEYTAVSDLGAHEVRLERSYFVPMRDGARLSTDLYIPEGLDRPQGTLRVRYREGLDREVLMEPGKVYPLEVDMNAISNTFLPGHRIRLEVASARFPNHDRNLGTGGDNFTESEGVVARNTVHHSESYPSQLILPIVAR